MRCATVSLTNAVEADCSKSEGEDRKHRKARNELALLILRLVADPAFQVEGKAADLLVVVDATDLLADAMEPAWSAPRPIGRGSA